MNITDVRTKATALGLGGLGRKKADLIRDIQRQEGNFPCFGTAESDCDQTACCWRDDCLPPRKKRRGKIV